MQSGAKGNFVALLARGTADELLLTNALMKNLAREKVLQNVFEFPNLRTPSKIISYLSRYSEVWNGGSGRFWFSNDGQGIPSVTVTDLGQYRRAITNCRSAACKIQQKRSNFVKRVLFLESVTKSLARTVRELTRPPKVETKNGANEVSVLDNKQFYKMLSTFLNSLTHWQFRIESKIAELAKLYSERGELNTDHVNLIYKVEKSEKVPEPQTSEIASNGPYFVIGDKSTNVPTLNRVIEKYYGRHNFTRQSTDSPMIVKVIT